MKYLRTILKPFALILMGIVGMLKLIGEFAVHMSGWLLRLAAGILFLFAIACLVFKEATWSQSGALIVLSFIIFTMPTIGEWLTDSLEGLNYRIRRFMRS